MTKKLKKSLASLLAMSMILSMVSVSAFAAEVEDEDEVLTGLEQVAEEQFEEKEVEISETPEIEENNEEEPESVPALKLTPATVLTPAETVEEPSDEENIMPLAEEPVVQTLSGEVNVTTAEELKVALNSVDVTKVTLTTDIDMGDEVWVGVVVDSGRELVIDGDGYTISNMVVNMGNKLPNGTGEIGDGGSCDYYAGFIANNEGDLTIQNLTFTDALVDIDPVTVNENSTGSSILAVVCANNMGTLRYENVTVKDSTVRGYTKVGILHGYTQKGSFVAERCIVTDSTVELEADGSADLPLFAGILIGYAPGGRSTTKGIFVENNQMVVSEEVKKAFESNGYVWHERDEGGYYISNGASTWNVIAPTYAGSTDTCISFAAEVDGFQYETLQAAIDAAKVGDTVTLVQDLDMTDLPGGYNVFDISGLILDMNEKTITSANSDSKGFMVFQGNDAKITNGTFAVTDGNYALFIGDEGDTDNFVVENVTATGINVYNATDVVLGPDSTVTAKGFYAVWCDENAHVTINGGKYQTIEQSTALLGMSLKAAELTIRGGEFTSGNKPMVLTGEFGIPVIEGGTFSSDVAAYLAPTVVQDANGEVRARAEGDEDAVAAIGEDVYASLQAAIDAAEAGDTVTLVQDTTEEGVLTIAEGKDVTLDLNGKKLTIDTKQESAIFVYGKLTIEDSGETGVLSHNGNYGLRLQGGELVVNGGLIEGTANINIAIGINNTDTEASTCTINGGELHANSNVILWTQKDSVLTLNGGKLVGYGGVEMRSGTLEIPEDSTVEITATGFGGGFSYLPQSGSNIFGAAIAVDHYEKATVNIAGGTFTGYYALLDLYTSNATWATEKNEIKVTGGTFVVDTEMGKGSYGAAITENAQAVYTTTEGTISISGGTFSTDVTDYCVEGTEWDEETGGIVPAADSVAIVGNVGYTTLQAAITAAPAGGSVQVLKDVTLTGSINPGKEITIEGVNKEDGSKPVISGDKGLFSFTKASGTLKNLELQATGNTWYIYHSAGEQTGEVKLTVSGCEFTMAEGVTAVGNLVMTEGTKTKTPVVFTGNTVKAHSRAAFAGPGDNTVITDNVIDLMGETYANGGRTSVIGLTATAETGDVVITGNVFQNVNRVLAVDNAPNMPADKLIFQNNKFIDCRWAFELKGNDEREFNINYNYYSFNNQVSEPKIEDADGAAGHFDDENAYTGEGVVNDVYYTTEEMERTLTLTPASVSIRVGNAAALAAASNTMGGTVTWTSSDPTVASVSESGEVTGLSVGSAVITAAMGDTTATCAVTVTQTTSGGGSTGGSTVTTPPEEDLQDEETPLTEKPFLFEDVAETDWFYESVKYVFNNDLMGGTSETLFNPTMFTSRGMIVTILHRLEGEPEGGENTFPDVEEDQWYTNAVTWGAPLGVVKGYGDGTFGPMDDITREQLAVFLFRYAEWKGYDVTGRDDLSNFGDAESVSSWALEAVQWAVSEGLLKGTNVGLNPLGNASRAEAAEVMFRFCEAHAETEEEAE